MKKILLTAIFLLFVFSQINAQVDQYDPACSTPDLDSATAVSLPWYNNNQFLENYLVQKGYNNLTQISFPTPNARTTTTTFLEPMFLVPLNIYIYRDGANNPNTSITESDARDYVCLVNEIFRNAGTAIQFYTNFVEFEGNEFFNNKISSKWEVYDLWSRKRFSTPAAGNGINVHFIRYNNAPENNGGKASLPYYPVLPYSNYSLYVRTHLVFSDGSRGGQRLAVDNAATLAHEIGHTLSLLHTHHPGRLPSLIFNETNATISNGCYQESVSRVKSNYWYNGCLSTDGLAKCGINGDFLCDTDADPRQSGLVSGCTFIPPLSGDYRTDNWGDIWTPPTHNVMSYSNSACLDQFSRSQTAIMWRQMEHFRTFISYQAPAVSSASNTVCIGSNLAFTLSGTLPNDANVTWQVQPANLVSVSSGTGLTANLSAASTSAIGSVNIVFTMIGPGNCYIARIQKTVWIGKGVADPLIEQKTVVCPTSNYYSILGRVTLSPDINTSYKWYIGTANRTNFVLKITTSSNSATVPGDIVDNLYHTLRVDITNACGTVVTAYQEGRYKASCTGGGGGTFARIFPNPASSQLTVGLSSDQSTANNLKVKTDGESDIDLTADFEAKLYDSFQQLVRSGSSQNGIVNFSIADLSNGVYYIHVNNGEQIIRKQILISK